MSSGFEGLQSLLNPKEGSKFLQTQTNSLFGSKQTSPFSGQVYVNPINMKSSSLEMCNETLGDESGSSIDSSLDEYSYLMLENKNSNINKARKTRKYCKKSSVFPPPLTSMNGIKVEARREGGRLVITASNFRGIHFKSERENGRLRLFLVRKRIDEKSEKDVEKIGCKREIGEFSRCNGGGLGGKNLPTLPVCLAFS